MGIFLSPGNEAFRGIRNGRYVDKSGLIALINETIDTPLRLSCVSRPRRFGKSFAAQMLCAYYDRSCDSQALFDDLEIAHSAGYRTHLNRYNVICIDMTDVLGAADDFISYISRSIRRELMAECPGLDAGEADESLGALLVRAAELTGHKFIAVIDEWDAPIRERPELTRDYLEFLRMLFKSSQTTPRAFAAAYMTGILPIKKTGSQSAISDFQEYTLLEPLDLAPYFGFIESEVKALCDVYGGDFTEMKRWYDGYTVGFVDAMYNPNSVIKALRSGHYGSYWTETSAASSLMHYISIDRDGLGRTIAQLVAGIDVPVDTNGFANDLITFRDSDDVLTLLIHLGYLTYDMNAKTVRIPNEEIRMEFDRALRDDGRPETIKRIAESDQLIMDIIHRDTAAVAAQIQKVHMESTNPLNANNENALRATIQLALFSYRDYYIKLEELPTGRGYADVVYLPKRDSYAPALLVELKWNDSPDAAIAQIKQKHYPTAIQGYGGELLLVGISYDKTANQSERRFSCIIEELSIE